MSRPRKAAPVALAAALLAAGLTPLVLAAPASAAPARFYDDFNGDGYRDLVTAAPSATVGGKARAGAVVVNYGSGSGISGSRHTVITQNTAGVPGTAEQGDEFGSALASGDLDRDGYADLVVGVPAENGESGTAVVVRGGKSGLSGAWTVPDPAPSAHDDYGQSLAVGDFTGDGRADLAVGSTGKDVWIFRGGFTKASGAASRFVLDTDLETGAIYGAEALAAADVNGDGTDDLVITGTYHPDDFTYDDGQLVYTGSAGPSPLTLQTVLRSGGYETAAVGDLNGDGYDDVIAAVPPGTGSANLGGAVRAYLGSASGVRSTPQTTITQDSPGVPGSDEKSDWFGHSLSVGDVNGDGRADVAVGAIYEAIGPDWQTGSVTVLRGSAAGLTGTGAQSFSQDTAGVPGSSEDNDFFGSAVRLSDLNGDRKADLSVGAFGENDSDGAVWSLRGSASGIRTTGAVSFGPATTGVPTTGYPGLGRLMSQ
ncbi:FG-GAP-like repeat-containing protein [Streptomyces sp. NPDC020800]|uniref:FG-GAP-like repeat-containing protein n=1 Tax=Streptomyces sp. NPDC020800 TaxID=3365092 RepID=UPI00378E21E1